MRTRILVHSAAALILLLGTISQANAIPMLRLTTSSGATVTVTDGDANDSSNLAGLVLFNGPLGDWIINVTTGLSKPAAGTITQPILDLNSLDMTSNGAAGSITLELTDTDFTAQPNAAHVATAIGGTAAGNVTFRTFFDEANQAFGQGVELTSAAFTGGAFSGEGSSALTALNPYSMTLLVTIAHDGGGPWQMTSFDAAVRVPEPASLLLLGLGLLVMAFTVRRGRMPTALEA